MIGAVVRSRLGLLLSLICLLGGCERLFGLDHIPDPPKGDGGLIDTPPGQCGHRSVAAGRSHTCAIDSAGAVWCWGRNEEWQVKAGADEVVLDPVRIDLLPGPAAQVSVGRSVSCARLVDGSLWCWGKNENGEVGTGTTSERLGPNPVDLAGESAIDVEVGAFHVCIRRASDLAVMCWGSNSAMELADPAAPELLTPTLVAGTEGMQRISVGHRHTCGITAAGGVQCWGKGDEGQLGQAGVASVGLVDATGISGATAISAGGRSTCAVVDGTARCWGYNENGQLGNGSVSDLLAPGAVVTTNAIDVAEGTSGGCALGADGQVQCWGLLVPGDGTFSSSRLPRPSSVMSASSIAAGFHHVCAIVDGTVQCWGMNDFGELGRGARDVAPAPTTVTTLPAPVVHVALGARHACAVLTSGEVYCWGANDRGQLGDGTHSSVNAPVKVATGITGILGIAARQERTCVWNTTNARCWGTNPAGALGNGIASHDEPSPVAVTATGLSSIAIGQQHTCGITNTATLVCWGANYKGQLGNDTTTDSLTPVNVPVGTVSQVVAGSRHTCARKTDNTVACWGDNERGELGNGTTSAGSKAPVAVTSLAGVTDISAARRSTCAIASGLLKCWGSNDVSQLGLGSGSDRSMPTQVTLPAAALDVELGAYGGCVTLVTKATYCWGANERGQLGNGQTQAVQATPVEVAAVGGNNTLRLEQAGGCQYNAGTLQCWGTTSMLGNGDASSAEPRVTSLACP
jgi:alpha-tubulin suppressor-like RCC1 family protein